MKIDNRSVNAILANPLESGKYHCVLLYGENESLVEERCKALMDFFSHHSYDITPLSVDGLKNENSALAEKFFAISMFATKELFILKLLEKENSFTKQLEELFGSAGNLTDNPNFLLLTCGNLDGSSSLRKYAEKSPHIACIACYRETQKNIETFIVRRLRELNFSFKSEIVNYLSEHLGENSLIIENELQKLDLYKDSDRNLSLEDVQRVIADVASSDMDKFRNDFCDLNFKETLRDLTRMRNEGVESVVILRTMIRYFLQLQKISFLISQGEDREEIFTRERIFWKQQISMKNHLRIWSLPRIGDILEKLLEAEKKIKFSTRSAMELENFILKLLLKFTIRDKNGA